MEAVAKLKNYPTSPRKMRLLADLVRGKDVEQALAILEHSPKHPAVPLHKLIWSAVHNWKAKNEGGDEGQLVVKTIMVDGARTLKRMRPAPQGRGYRVRKRSNHVTVVVDVKGALQEKKIKATTPVEEEAPVNEEVQTKAAKPSKAKAEAGKTKKTTTKKKTSK